MMCLERSMRKVVYHRHLGQAKNWGTEHSFPHYLSTNRERRFDTL